MSSGHLCQHVGGNCRLCQQKDKPLFVCFYAFFHSSRNIGSSPFFRACALFVCRLGNDFHINLIVLKAARAGSSYLPKWNEGRPFFRAYALFAYRLSVNFHIRIIKGWKLKEKTGAGVISRNEIKKNRFLKLPIDLNVTNQTFGTVIRGYCTQENKTQIKVKIQSN